FLDDGFVLKRVSVLETSGKRPAAKLQQRLADAEGRCTAPEWIATILVDKDHVTCRRGIFGEFNHSLRSGRPRVQMTFTQLMFSEHPDHSRRQRRFIFEQRRIISKMSKSIYFFPGHAQPTL